MGRFLQEDPVGYLLGPNLYTYCGNDPINWVDPFGLGPEERSYDQMDDGIDPDPLGDAIISGIAFAGYGITKGIITGIRYKTFWRYIGPRSDPNSRWLTKGRFGRPPYGKDFTKAKDALQIPHKPTGVIKVKVPRSEPVTGPRPAVKYPKWGKGGGPEYYRGPDFPD